MLISSSLDSIYRRHGPIEVDILGKITHAVLKGLVYLYDEHRIIHRGNSVINLLYRCEAIEHSSKLTGYDQAL